MQVKEFDAVILGAGIFGLYSAFVLSRLGKKVLILDPEKTAFDRASSINQARVHFGYHYPRSIGTAKSSIEFFRDFNDRFQDAIHSKFEKIYAIASTGSHTQAKGFLHFCEYLQIPIEEVSSDSLFHADMVEAAFRTKETSFDFGKVRDQLLADISRGKTEFEFGNRIKAAKRFSDHYELETTAGLILRTRFVLNSTYASINSVLSLFGQPGLQLKYELTEVALVRPSALLANLGVTVMDGPYFSVMPFGLTGLHSLTAVEFTPHRVSKEKLPTFQCQPQHSFCRPENIWNCNKCELQPQSAFPWMRQLMKNFLTDSYDVEHSHSLFTVKTVLKSSELDDSRPTLIDIHVTDPYLISIFSGKINTIFEIEGVLNSIAGRL